jgi:guanine nucleotide-binding protein G(i) subunit alpha
VNVKNGFTVKNKLTYISGFEGVQCIIFVTSLSEYNQKCYEDDETNRMKESLLVFDEIVNSRW